eukprot:28597-Eustigmatos_ZCMA.PRE.1
MPAADSDPLEISRMMVLRAYVRVEYGTWGESSEAGAHVICVTTPHHGHVMSDISASRSRAATSSYLTQLRRMHTHQSSQNRLDLSASAGG